MPTMVIAFPILPGKQEQARQFAQEARARESELAQSFARQDIRWEEWFLQQTPQGGMVLVSFEANDPHRAFDGWARSQDSFDLWFKEQACQISGIDFNNPLPALPEQIFAWSAS